MLDKVWYAVLVVSVSFFPYSSLQGGTSDPIWVATKWLAVALAMVPLCQFVPLMGSLESSLMGSHACCLSVVWWSQVHHTYLSFSWPCWIWSNVSSCHSIFPEQTIQFYTHILIIFKYYSRHGISGTMQFLGFSIQKGDTLQIMSIFNDYYVDNGCSLIFVKIYHVI